MELVKPVEVLLLSYNLRTLKSKFWKYLMSIRPFDALNSVAQPHPLMQL